MLDTCRHVRCATALVLIALLTASCGRGASAAPLASVTGVREEAQATASVVSPRVALTPGATATPTATPAPCLEGVPLPAPTPAGALRITYWSQGKLWEWAEESGIAAPFPLPEDAAAARISADGEWIAYQRVLDERTSELWAVHADGTNARLLATVDAAETYARYPYLIDADLRFDWVQGTHTVALYLQPRFEGLGQLPYEAVHLADAETGAVRQVIPAGEVWHLVYAPDGGQLAALTSDELRLIDGADGRVQHRYQLPLTCGPWQSLAYSPDGRHLAAFHLAGIAIVDARDGTRKDIPFDWKPIGMGEFCETPPILWLEDAPAFYTAVGKGETPDELLAPSSTFTVWRVDAREAAATALHTFTGSVLSAQVSPDHRRVAYWVQERDNTRHLYLADVESGRQVLYMSGTPESILVFRGWNPDSARFLIEASGLKLGQICGAPEPLSGVTARNGLTWLDAERFLAFRSDDSHDRWELSLHTVAGEVTWAATLTDPPHYRFRFVPAAPEEPAPGSAG